MELKNKNVIITGAADGIGKELVRQLLEYDANIVAVDISKEKLQKLEEEFKNPKLKTYVLDVTDDEGIKAFRKSYKEELDILINNAGIVQPFIEFKDLDQKMIDRVMNVNFFGPVKITKLFLEDLIKRPVANITNISSMGGFFPFPKQTIYGASKAALKLFSEGLYAELMDTNVHVLTVFPGAIKTDILKNSNVEFKSRSTKSYKMTSVEDTAKEIIRGIEKEKFKLYIGSDSKFMNKFYKFSDKRAIRFVKKKMFRDI